MTRDEPARTRTNLAMTEEEEEYEETPITPSLEAQNFAFNTSISRNVDQDKVLATTNDHHDPTECKGKRKSSKQDHNNIINTIISFDPTWDLLIEETDPANHTTLMVRSRLKKFYEIENYAESLLGKNPAEESSEESIDMLGGSRSDFESEELSSSSPSSSLREELIDSISELRLNLQLSEHYHNRHPEVMKQKRCVDNFELGFHFDSEKFPTIVPSEEIEICFYQNVLLKNAPLFLKD